MPGRTLAFATLRRCLTVCIAKIVRFGLVYEQKVIPRDNHRTHRSDLEYEPPSLHRLQLFEFEIMMQTKPHDTRFTDTRQVYSACLSPHEMHAPVSFKILARPPTASLSSPRHLSLGVNRTISTVLRVVRHGGCSMDVDTTSLCLHSFGFIAERPWGT